MQTHVRVTQSIDIPTVPGRISTRAACVSLAAQRGVILRPVPGLGYFSPQLLALPCTYQTILGSSCFQNTPGSTIFSEDAQGSGLLQRKTNCGYFYGPPRMLAGYAPARNNSEGPGRAHCQLCSGRHRWRGRAGRWQKKGACSGRQAGRVVHSCLKGGLLVAQGL